MIYKGLERERNSERNKKAALLSKQRGVSYFEHEENVELERFLVLIIQRCFKLVNGGFNFDGYIY